MKIDSTEDYYILKTLLTKSNDSVTLVINKLSKQIIENELKLNCIYEFETYTFFDIVALGGPYCHDVQGINVWCDSEDSGLHFTDSMGNTIFRDGVIK